MSSDLQYRFVRCAGDSFDRGWFLAQRFVTRASKIPGREPEPDPDRSDYWIGTVVDGAIGELWGTRAPLDDVCVTEDGGVFVATGRALAAPNERAGVLQLEDPDQLVLTPHPLPDCERVLPLRGGGVLAWAERALPGGTAHHWDGARWASLPLPELRTTTIVGPQLDCLLALGEDGRVAWRIGDAWGPPEQLPCSVVFAGWVESAERAWALGFQPEALFEWDGRQWRRTQDVDGVCFQLVSHRDTLWGAFGDGLRRLDGTFEQVPLSLPGRPRWLHSGLDALLITAHEGLAEVREDRETRRIDVDALRAQLGERPPMWETGQLDAKPTALRHPPERSGESQPLRYELNQIVGESFDDAVFRGWRGEPGGGSREDSESESWLCRIAGGTIRDCWATRAPIRHLSRAPSGTLYAAVRDRAAGVWRSRSAESLADWERMDLQVAEGVFALRDDWVMAWGPDLSDRSPRVGQVLFRFDGRRWHPMPRPSGRVVAVDGCAEDCVVAVGERGLIARWDGSKWREARSPARGTLGSVQVLSPEEMYATGPCGVVLEGSIHGWVERAPAVASVSVRSFRGVVYVADPVSGLQRLEGDRLVPADPLIAFPRSLHAGADALLMVERDGLVETRDHVSTTRIPLGAFEQHVRGDKPLWW